LPVELRRAFDALAEATGTRIVVVRNLTPDALDFNGVNFRDGVLYVNEKADMPAVLVAAHEWVHQFKRDQPALYQRLEDEVRRQGKLPEFAARLRSEGENRASVVAEELTADAVADAMIDPAFLRRVVEEGGTLRQAARAFLRYLDGLLTSIRGRNTSAYLRDVQAFRDELAAVLREYQNRETAPTDADLGTGAANTDTPAFRNWFGRSRVVDDAGNPIVVYHGTGEEFDAFDRARLGATTAHTSAGLGFFFTPDRASAQAYADKASDFVPADAVVLETYLSIQNPYTMTLAEAQSIEDAAEANAMRLSLQSRGFDGIHIPEQNAWVAFRANQVKRTDNLGTWDPADDRMRFQRPASGDLFARPTQAEEIRAEQERRDAKRDGRTGTGRTDMMAGDGELFAGPRPEQADIERDGPLADERPQRALFQRRSVPQAQAEAAAKRRIANSGLGNPMNGGALGWNSVNGTWIGSREALRKARATFQDKMISLRDTQQDIEAMLGNDLPDLQNVYQLENQMNGRIRAGAESLDDRHLNPLFEALRKAKVTTKELEEYIEARHAEERNDEVAAINPAMPDGGSGMLTEDARAILAKADRAKMEPLALRIDAIVKETRKRLLDAGVITQAVYDALEAQYQHYVPLRGKEEADQLNEEAQKGMPAGIGIRSSGIVGMMGRGAGNRAQNILGEIIGDAQRSIMLAERARVGRGLARLVLANPNPAFWQMEAVRTEQAKDSQGQVYMKVVNESTRPDVVPLMIKGQPYRIQFKDANLAAALMNIGGTGRFVSQPFVRPFAWMQRYIAATLTAWNPGFASVNILRDLQFGLARIATTHGALDAGMVFARYPLAIRAMWRLERRKAVLEGGMFGRLSREQRKMESYAREFEASGGKVGWLNIAGVEALGNEAMWRAKDGPAADARRLGKAALKVIEDFNDTFENAMRLSYYARLRDGGMTAQQATQRAKDLTVNFDRKGTAGAAMGVGYLFFNAAVQGTHAFGKSINPNTSHGKKLLAGLAGISMLQFALAAIAAGMEDEDGESMADKVPPHIKERNLWWIGADGGINTIPMAFGFNIFTYAGSRSLQLITTDAEDVSTEARTASQVASAMTGDMFRVALSATFPIQIAQSGAASIIPTEVGQQIVQQAANRDDFGRPIWNKNPYDTTTPRAVLGRDATPEPYKVIATGLNRLGGGDDYTKPISALDVAPEQIQFFVESLTGGTGRFFGGVAQTAYSAAVDPEANEQRPIPIIQTVMRPVNENQAAAARYFERRDAIRVAADRIRDIAEAEGVDAAIDYADSLPFMAGVAIKITKSGEAQIRPGSSRVYAAFKDAEKAGDVFRDDRRQAYMADPDFFSADRAKALREASATQAEAHRSLLREWNAATEKHVE